MYQLSIDHGRSVTISDHPDRDDAHGALLRYVIGANYYLRPIQLGGAHTSYELLQLGELAEPDRELYRGPGCRPRRHRRTRDRGVRSRRQPLQRGHRGVALDR